MNDVLSKIKTKEESLKVLNTLEDALSKLYIKGTSIKDLLSDLNFKLTPGYNEKESIENTVDKIKKAEVLELTTKIPLESEFTEKLYKWFEKAGYKEFLLDIKVDDSISGGLLISYNGKYLDASLRNRIAEAVQDEYTKI